MQSITRRLFEAWTAVRDIWKRGFVLCFGQRASQLFTSPTHRIEFGCPRSKRESFAHAATARLTSTSDMMRWGKRGKLRQQIRDLETSEMFLCQQVDSLKTDNDILKGERSRLSHLLQESNDTLLNMNKALKSSAANKAERHDLIESLNQQLAAAEDLFAQLYQRITANAMRNHVAEPNFASETETQKANGVPICALQDGLGDVQEELMKCREVIHRQNVESIVQDCIWEAACAAAVPEKRQKQGKEERRIAVCLSPREGNLSISKAQHLLCSELFLAISCDGVLVPSRKRISDEGHNLGCLGVLKSFWVWLFAQC